MRKQALAVLVLLGILAAVVGWQLRSQGDLLATALLRGTQPGQEQPARLAPGTSGAVDSAPPAPTPTPVPAQVTYEVVQRMAVVNYGPGQPDKHNLWVALIGDVPPYQKVRAMQIRPDDYRLITDEYGNRYAEFDLADLPAGDRVLIEISYRVTVYRIEADLSRCEGEVPDEFNRPELHIESNNVQIVELAAQLSQGPSNACQQVRAFYDYISSNLVYTYNGQNWGAQAALGEMGADCTEFSSLLIALSRASGLPARYLEGLNYFADEAEALARREHSWVEVFLPGIGWVPMDPTLGRYMNTRSRYFASLPPDHIIVTRGRNPSTLRGASYWTHLYWPGLSASIRVEDVGWEITPLSTQPK